MQKPHNQESLFEDGEIPIIGGESRTEKPKAYKELEGLKEKERKKRRLLNKHLLPKDCPHEGLFQLPKVLPYTGEIPDVFIPYSAAVCYNSQYKGVYCNIDDSGFSSTWNQPLKGLAKVSQYMVAIGPDHTLWVDALVCENIEQLRKNRTTTLFWQTNGVPTIPCASWGDAHSINTYAFDGLPENSWIAIEHHRIGTKSEQRLFKYAIMKLIEKKHPIGLVIFGAKLEFDPGIPVKYFPSFISKLRKL